MTIDTSVWKDFDFLRGCFGNPRIAPTDIDGIVEINHHFFVFEAKPCNVPVPRGQLLMLMRLAEIPKFTVLVLYHTIGKELHAAPIYIEMQILPDTKKIRVNNDDIRIFVKKWCMNARSPLICGQVD